MNFVPSELKWKILLFVPGVPNILKYSILDKGFFEPTQNDNFWKDVLILNFKEVFAVSELVENLLEERKTYYNATKTIFKGLKHVSKKYTSSPYEKMTLRIVGVTGVGKTSICDRFFRGTFGDFDGYNSGIEDCYTKNDIELFSIKFSVDVLDTSGTEEYAALKDAYTKKGEGFLLVFDLTNRQTLDQLDEFHQQIYYEKHPWSRDDDVGYVGESPLPMIVVGNKNDLKDERKVGNNDENKITKKLLGVKHYIETSAKTGMNIDTCLELIMKEVLVFQLCEWFEREYGDSDQKKTKRKYNNVTLIHHFSLPQINALLYTN